MTLPGLALFYGALGLGEGVGVGKALGVQLVGLLAVALWAGMLNFVIVKLTSALVGLRVRDDDEAEGLDIAAHGERGYEI